MYRLCLPTQKDFTDFNLILFLILRRDDSFLVLLLEPFDTNCKTVVTVSWRNNNHQTAVFVRLCSIQCSQPGFRVTQTILKLFSQTFYTTIIKFWHITIATYFFNLDNKIPALNACIRFSPLASILNTPRTMQLLLIMDTYLNVIRLDITHLNYI